MASLQSKIESILDKAAKAEIRIQTLGTFQIWRNDSLVAPKEWGRDAVAQLLQFFIANRNRHAMHKEQIIDEIWDTADTKSGQQNFKVALHGVNKILEPNRKSRTEARFILRQGLTYQLKSDEIWIDVEAFDQLITIGHQNVVDKPDIAEQAYYEATRIYQGAFLPNRLYEDWSSEERERIQLAALNALVSLSELIVVSNPVECIRLAQQALQIDPTWEDAYRIQMEAYFEKGNRPMAIKTYRQCQKILDEEFGIEPLPETKTLLRQIQKA